MELQNPYVNILDFKEKQIPHKVLQTNVEVWNDMSTECL